MTSALKSLLYASRCLALIGLLALTSTEEITGLWIQAAWFVWALSFFLDGVPSQQRLLRRWETPAVVMLVCATLADLFFLKNSFFIVIAHFLLLFQIFKLAGLKERKDSLQIGLIGFFQLLAACTLSADVWQAVLLILLIPAATALLYWNYAALVAEQTVTSGAWPRHFLQRMHVGISVAALPLNVLMTAAVFILFPRLTFNVHVPGFGANRSAYTDQMNLAQTGALSQDPAVAAWLGFSDEDQRNRWNGYLRGDILDTFDGRVWTNAHKERTRALLPDLNAVFSIARVSGKVHPLHVRLTLLNTTKSTLFTPGTPLEITSRVPHLEFSDAGELHWTESLQHPLQVQMLILAGERQDPAPDPVLLESVYMQLPNHGLERTQHLAQAVSGNGSAAEKAHALEVYLRQHYTYSLDFGRRIPDNPVDAFLFERKQGFCMHFAAALAVMLRLNGIPSRVVAGYYQGEWNALAGQILFREKDAHAWVEAWVGNRWITLDPSPRASTTPESLQFGRRIQLHLRQAWDYVGYQWNRLIIEYDLYAQLRTLERLRSRSDRISGLWSTWLTHLRAQMHQAPTPEDAATDNGPRRHTSPSFKGPLTVMGLGGIVGLIFWSLRRRRRATEIPDFYLRFLRRLARQGLHRKRTETAAEFAARATQRWPERATLIKETTSAYYQARFGKSN